MESSYQAKGVSLHVRVSNTAAKRLYCDTMGYGVLDVIRKYYQDGEDAYLMRKNFGVLSEEKGMEEGEKDVVDVVGSSSSSSSGASLEQEKEYAPYYGVRSSTSNGKSSQSQRQRQRQLQDNTVTMSSGVSWSDAEEVPRTGATSYRGSASTRSSTRLQAWNPKRWGGGKDHRPSPSSSTSTSLSMTQGDSLKSMLDDDSSMDVSSSCAKISLNQMEDEEEEDQVMTGSY